MTLPNFVIIGAAKSGTSALHYYLNQHPQVYMSPQKETNFFAFEGSPVNFHGPGDEELSDSAITTLSAYEKQFEGVSAEIAIGEASPWYLYVPRAASNMHHHIPDAKLMAVLRHPVERAYSSYLHVVRDGREELTFEEGILAEEDRIARGWEYIWHYRHAGFYAKQVERISGLFGAERVRYFLYDDLLADPNSFLRATYQFLGVDPSFTVNTSVRPNATGIPKNRLIGRLLFEQNPLRERGKMIIPKRYRYRLGQRLRQRSLDKPSLNRALRTRLLREFRSDILVLQDLIGRDLSGWIDR